MQKKTEKKEREKLLEKFTCPKSDLADQEARERLAEEARKQEAESLSAELQIGKLLLADSYGIAPDGGEVIPPFQQAEILQPDLPRDEQRNNPGIY